MNSCNNKLEKYSKLSKNDHNNKDYEVQELVSKPSSHRRKISHEILPYSVRSLNDEFWDNFRSYLTNEQHSHSSIRDKISYAKRFYFVLQKEDASSLTQLTPDVKSHVMKSLANLSKFIGKYDRWLEVIKKYQLKWSNGGKNIKAFNAIFQKEGNTYSSMLDWINRVISVLPDDYRNIILFNTLTGLRPDEAQKFIWLIKTKGTEYIDNKRGLLKNCNAKIVNSVKKKLSRQ